MLMRPRRSWRARDYAQLALLLGVGLWLHRAPLLDMVSIGWRDEEQSHILLAPFVAIWLLWWRRTRLRYVMVQPSFWGLAIACAGWLISWWGFENGTQIAWHGGAVLSLAGILLSMTGLAPLVLFAPVFAALVFLLPVPGEIRHGIAHPLQIMATGVTHSLLEVIGIGALRSGNVLIINGEPVAVGEACNGMRMVFALTLVVYAFAFGTPLKTPARFILLAFSPIIAMLCNVVRLVPTSLLYGYGSADVAQQFHDIAGWVMLPVALIMLVVILRTIRWLEFPVVQLRLANQ